MGPFFRGRKSKKFLSSFTLLLFLHPQFLNLLNMKRLLLLAVLGLFTVFQAQAVLKEKDLAQTLGVLRAELAQSYNEQQARMARFQKRNLEQHRNLISMMQRSNQIALMLYSQNSDFTFDMAYACQAATEQYRNLREHHMPYDKIKDKVSAEIDRYEKLITALQNIPPRVLPNGELAKIPDSIRALLPKLITDTSKSNPFILDEQGMQDREACLEYATALRDLYLEMLEVITRDEGHYKRVTERVGNLNAYALERYEMIQKNIFVNGGNNYFKTLKRFKWHLMNARKDVDDKYKPLSKKSEWRGPVIVGVSIFMVFYILLASILSYVIVRWLLPKKMRERIISKKKRPLFTLACGVVIFVISITIARFFTYQNFIKMAIDLMITYAWLLEVILVSLLIRLSDTQIRAGVRAYFPFMVMAFVVIVFRMILIPNNLVNLIYPPILLLFTIWQSFVLRKKIAKLPTSDMIYSMISLIAMIISCVAAWAGFVLMAVQIMIWWTFQLAAIQTITCCFDISQWYESRYLIRKIALERNVKIKNHHEAQALLKKTRPKMEKGEYIAQTWFFDFMRQALLPVAGVASVLLCFYWAANTFEMTSICKKIFMTNFIDKPGVIQLSIFKLCLVLAMFFVFRYLNYAIRAFYKMLKKHSKKDANGVVNMTLANNLISIIVWGSFLVVSLVLLQIPSKGISIVMAGLATGLGFAMKDLLENFVYGLSLMTGRLRVGDYIECDGVQGKVESINYQSTQIVTLDGCVIAFQNAALFSKNFKNLTRNHGYVMVKIPVGVAYGVNVDRVRQMLIKGLEPLKQKNAAGKYVVDVKQGFVVTFSDFGESSVDLFVICWVLVEEKASFVGKVKEVIYNTLNKNNVEIPFPQHDVYVRRIEMPETSETMMEKAVKRMVKGRKITSDNEDVDNVDK